MPIEAIARTYSTPTGRSVSCSGVCGGRTIGRSGRTGSPRRPGRPGSREMIGARTKTGLSAAFGMMSSFSVSLTPSARLCSRPNGPSRFGPMRCCIRADDAALEPDGEQRQERRRITKISDDLDERRATTGRGRTRGQRAVTGRARAARLMLALGSLRRARPASPAPTPRSAAHGACRRELVGSQTTPSARSATHERQRDRARRRGDRDSGRRRRRRAPRAVAGRQRGDRAARGRPRGAARRPAAAVVEQQAPGREHGLAATARWRRRQPPASTAGSGGAGRRRGHRSRPSRQARAARPTVA